MQDGQPKLDRSQLAARLLYACPPFAMQRRIAAVLSAFDELIEINERRIELLEDLARSLYREWFVHFRFPGHEGVEFVDSPRGQIPEGWRVARFDELSKSPSRGLIQLPSDQASRMSVLNTSRVAKRHFENGGRLIL